MIGRPLMSSQIDFHAIRHRVSDVLLGDNAYDIVAMRNAASFDNNRHKSAPTPHPVDDIERDGVLASDRKIATGYVTEIHSFAGDFNSPPEGSVDADDSEKAPFIGHDDMVELRFRHMITQKRVECRIGR
jgi:hypothetical protein